MVHNIFINGYIGDIFDLFGDGNNFTLNKLNQELAANPDATEIIVHINSGGGLVSEGFAIYDKLVATGKPITTIVEGMCGSIATVIAQAGKTGKRKMFQNSEYFIHNPLWIPNGPDAHTADDLETLTADLRKSEEKLINFYEKVTGANRVALSDKMKVETTLTSAEALQLGFIDEVISTDIRAMVKYRIAAAVTPTQTNKNNNTMSELKEEIKAGFASMEKTFLNLFKGRKVNATVKTTEGIDIYFDGVLAEGSPVFANEAMTEPAPDGVHTYDGKLYTVAGGVVTNVEEISNTQTPEQVAAAKIAELEAQVTAAKNETQAAITEKNEILAQANTLKTEFVALKSAIETGGGQTFVAAATDKGGAAGGEKKTALQLVAERRAAETKK
jgi:ATP-dependent Clp endopeptidase proteolytic subunit ClpP